MIFTKVRFVFLPRFFKVCQFFQKNVSASKCLEHNTISLLENMLEASGSGKYECLIQFKWPPSLADDIFHFKRLSEKIWWSGSFWSRKQSMDTYTKQMPIMPEIVIWEKCC